MKNFVHLIFVHNRAYENFLTTKISRTTVHWEQYKFSCFVLCREVLNVSKQYEEYFPILQQFYLFYWLK